MNPLFIASSMSNAAAAITLDLSAARGTSHRTLCRLERLDCIALLAELALLLTLRQRLRAGIARPMLEGELGHIYRFGILGLGIAAPLVLQVKSAFLGGAPSRLLTAVAATLTLAGGFMLRYLIVMAGRESADDPRATFEMTRDNGNRPG